jgi:hypothetical protein
MILTLGHVVSHATSFCGRSDILTSQASFYANLALGEVSTRVHHKPKEAFAVSSTTSGENRMALPPDFDYLLGAGPTLSTGSTAPILLMPAAEDEFDSLASTLGQPARYMVYGNELELSPTPDSGYSVQFRYAAKTAVLVESTETCLLDERWHPGWMWKATSLVCASKNNYEGMQLADQQYLNYMTSTPSDRQKTQSVKRGMNLRVQRS